MFKSVFARLHQGYRTNRFPESVPPVPPRFRGLPHIDTAKCMHGCSACISCCPTNSISKSNHISIDLGTCIFCTECASACPHGAIRFTNEFSLSARKRQDLLLKENGKILCDALDKKMKKIFGRSLKLRQVSAGGCNACEADINVLSTVGWDIGRFGISVVASPRHADGLLVTGPVTENMRIGLQKTYDALPAPKLVIAVGACAISGGIYRNSPQQHGGAGSLPVDLYIPGCPPHPLTILDGLLRLLDRM